VLVSAGEAEFFPFWSRALVGIGFRFRGSKNPQDKRVVKLQQALEFGISHENWMHGSETTPSPYDVAMFQYTGGTTGSSKAVMLTHSNIAVGVSQIVASLEHRVEPAHDTVMTTIPFSNSFAFMMNFLSFYWMGAKNILVPFSRPLHNLRDIFGEHKIAWLVGAPNFYRSLMGEGWFSGRPPLSLKAALSVGMSLQREIAEDFVYLTGAPLVEGYGLAEACSMVTLNSLRGSSVFTNSVGLPLGNTELGVVDTHGRMLGLGSVGKLVVRGAQVMVGYWNKPDATSRVLRDGWLFTGDLAQLLEDGSYRVMGRKASDHHEPSHEQSASEKVSDRKTPEGAEEANPLVGV
jgi:long-chain acyl-CoA synthetase